MYKTWDAWHKICNLSSHNKNSNIKQANITVKSIFESIRCSRHTTAIKKPIPFFSNSSTGTHFIIFKETISVLIISSYSWKHIPHFIIHITTKFLYLCYINSFCLVSQSTSDINYPDLHCDLLGYDTVQYNRWEATSSKNVLPSHLGKCGGTKFLHNNGIQLWDYEVS